MLFKDNIFYMAIQHQEKMHASLTIRMFLPESKIENKIFVTTF